MSYQNLQWKAADSTPLLAQIWQPADTQAVVCLVHGLGEHSSRYAHVAQRLNEAGYALLAFDLRGHGRSGGQRGHAPSYDALLQDIDLLLHQATQHFPGLPRFLYGHSMGGNLVLNYALRRRPDLAGVIATSPWLRLSFSPSPVELLAGRALNWLQPTNSFDNGLDPAHISHDPSVVEAYTADPLVHDQISARLFTELDRAGRWALEHAYQFPLPLLLMHGDQDPITSPQASADFAHKATGVALRLWSGLFHETHNEPEQDRVLDTMVEWLNAHTPSA